MSTRKQPAVDDHVDVLHFTTNFTPVWTLQRVSSVDTMKFYYDVDRASCPFETEGTSWRWPHDTARPFDEMIGRLDRSLSEFLEIAATQLDEPDRQTIKHHADDLIGVGKKAIELLARPKLPVAVGDEIEFATITGNGVLGWEARTVAYIGATGFKCRGMYEHLTDFTYASEGGLWRHKAK